jgi:hypothetical protein
MGPISGVTVSGRLCVADFGHLMFMWLCTASDFFLRAFLRRVIGKL